MVEQERIKAGQHIEKIVDLHPVILRQRVLRGAQLAGLDTYLMQYPLSELRLVGQLKDVSGYFTGDHFRGHIRLSARRVQDEDYGVPFRWGLNQTVASAAQSAENSVQRTFVHELGHYLLFRLAKQLGRDAVEKLIEPNYREARDHGFSVSKRAETNWSEYFCEIFSASVYHRKELTQNDPQGLKMIIALRTMLEVDK